MSRYANSGYGPAFSVLDIGLKDQVAVIEADSGFWALVPHTDLGEALGGSLVENFLERQEQFREEMHQLRFGLRPSAVYFNPTERCNFNCPYCYLPEDMRRSGETMTPERLAQALTILRDYFRALLPRDRKPELIFHGSEPLLARDAVFSAIEAFAEDFVFGVQTNGSLLDTEALDFLRSHQVAIGISLDAPEEATADKLRHSWAGQGAFRHVVRLLEDLADYPAFSVITTVTRENVSELPALIDFFASHGTHTVLLNPVRLTQERARPQKPDDKLLARFFRAALDRSHQLYVERGQKIVVANFANILAGILGPNTRRLMCDISPCGGGRCFFAISAQGDVFPCSEFIGLRDFCGGNLFSDALDQILESSAFVQVTTRTTESIHPCHTCALRHFCGAPCPAEVKALNGSLCTPSPYCQFYEDLIRYAFRVIARGEELDYLWDGWQEDSAQVYEFKQ